TTAAPTTILPTPNATTAAPTTTTTAAPTTILPTPNATTAAPTTTTTAAPTTILPTPNATTASPTTAAPTTTTTAAPTTILITPNATTASPTTAAPTTTTTAAPTTILPTPNATTASPTTAAPTTTTTAAPTTILPTPNATTAAPTTTTTAAPTTILPTPNATTASPTTAAPTTTTTAAPTTILPTPKATTASPTTAAPTITTRAAPTTNSTDPKTTNPATPITTATPMTTRTAPTMTTTAASTTLAAPMRTTAAGGQTTTLKPTSNSGVCASSPCLCGSTCEERADQTYVCLCLAGEAHGPKGCQKAKVFPGLLVWKEKYDPEMSDKTSQIFKETSDKIIDLIDKEFKNKPGHISSLLLELREVRRETGSVEASLQIIFETTSDFKEDAVTETMMNLTCESCPLPGSFTSKNLCDSDPCDNSSTTCKPTAGSFTCSCVDGYINTDYSDKLCMACRSGQKAVNNECKPCDFGRTGLNCEDERLLIVVIVSSVLGFLLVVALIALLVVVKKFKRTQFFRTKQEDIRKLFQIPSLAKGPLSSNSNGYYTWFKEPEGSLANSGDPRIPRANSISNWDNLAMTQWINEQNSPFDGNRVDMISFSQS
ncbi:mucin-13-like, partial [Gambusia affinis]|uniref:mucin-13-like n=1 Tax=Gambusia affinis TaxID=33528 RepID=UPI001CDC0763